MDENPVILVTAGYDHTIRMWDALKSTCTRTIPYTTESQINRMALSSDKHYLAVAGNPSVSLYDVFGTSDSPVLKLDGHKANVTAVEFTQDYKFLATSSEDETIRWWDVYAGNCKRVLKNSSIVNDIAIHPDPRQELIVSCDQKGAVRVWSWRHKENLCQAVPHSDVAVRSVAISPNGQLVVAGNNHGQLFVYRLIIDNSPQAGRTVELEPYINFDAHEGHRITRVLFSSNGFYLATCSSDHTAKLWRLTEAPVPAPNGTREEVVQPAVELMHTLNYHNRWVWDAAFSRDSDYLVTVSTDTRAALWSVYSGEIIREFKGHQKGVVCVALNDATG
ncbi:TOR complex subunit lst8 [Coemansia sp. BCRC 34490]|nr:TOR complex subunit lst8 [Coemansia sp. Benny D160-2]KAJ2513224.1 TOR complex subunit lst8 [Coemansia sp. RSA 1939]KAJ2606054.1 TOR complex subunit lst8 [Coemansia sp. RSA 1804]KAJ2661614.1 TOR complex subunit lst8 [Coemansia sp. RSA 1200]KAJ2692423.1 TOR complex subunit lst8 [Coemansia sp. RSA 1285]KAJ2733167.1 TOR complex subunit lst8 [Coemansia sp. BCRC 34490]